MTSPILVTGGTGTLGGHVVPLLREAGHDVRILCRTPRPPDDGLEYVAVDLLDGGGIDPAVAGVRTVLHLAGGTKGDDRAAQNLMRAAGRAGVEHVVYISVIGVDTVPIGWFRTQWAAEKAVVGSGVPFSVLRAAQFHDLCLLMAEKMARLPVVPVPGGLRFQPVDAREVAARLVELSRGRPTRSVAELVGPRVYEMGELLRSYLAARGTRRPLLPVRMPGKAGRAYRAGANLALHGNDVGERTWEDFLAQRVTHAVS